MTPLPPALLSAICENPADDGPRLIAADFWDDAGDTARAEFVRVQVEIAEARQIDVLRAGAANECAQCFAVRMGKQHTNGPCRCSPIYRAIRARERELLEKYGCDWLPRIAGLATFKDKGQVGWLLKHSSEPGYDFPATFRRGFVAAITLTAAAFLGGECGHCNGENIWLDPRQRMDNCPFCHGTGRTGGCAESLFRAAPIEEVRLTDAEPDYVDREPGFPGWTWQQSNRFNQLWLDGHWLKWFSNEHDAKAYLRKACVAHGRRLARLPAIRYPTRGKFTDLVNKRSELCRNPPHPYHHRQ